MGWTADSGSILKLTSDGFLPVAEGLNYPYGMAISPEGTLVVTLNSTFSGAGNGQVVVVNSDGTVSAPVETVDDGGDDAEVEAPAETPEAPAETPEAESAG